MLYSTLLFLSFCMDFGIAETGIARGSPLGTTTEVLRVGFPSEKIWVVSATTDPCACGSKLNKLFNHQQGAMLPPTSKPCAPPPAADKPLPALRCSRTARRCRAPPRPRPRPRHKLACYHSLPRADAAHPTVPVILSLHVVFHFICCLHRRFV
jgi:hypothetical protein